VARRVVASDVIPDADLRPIDADPVFSTTLGKKCGDDCGKSNLRVVDDFGFHGLVPFFGFGCVSHVG
jgi:hypothetical protein